ncbi:MAG TPA: DUF2480 family protein [Chitinophagaceae bacterium]|nr:DUF2480 family protein [Chitinophagaceae bacterium]
MSDVIVNKVAESSLITLNLEDYYPKNQSVLFDIKNFLFMGLILKEKDFRDALLQVDWEQYKNKNVAVTCTADAIIPVWAYMLVAAYLQPVANEVVFGNEDFMHKALFLKNLAKINPNDFADKRIVVKGCGDLPVTEMAYVEITRILRPVAKSIMYGEPCSTVPIFKKK